MLVSLGGAVLVLEALLRRLSSIGEVCGACCVTVSFVITRGPRPPPAARIVVDDVVVVVVVYYG